MTVDISAWKKDKIKEEQITKYLNADGSDFINVDAIENELKNQQNPDPAKVRDIIAKALAIETLSAQETATILNVQDPQLWLEMEQAAGAIKKKVYDNRDICTFISVYCLCQ